MKTIKIFWATIALTSFLVMGQSQAEDLERGKFLYKNCAQCHGDQAQGSYLIKAPQLSGLSSSYIKTQINHFKNNIRGAHPDDVAGLKMRPMANTLRTDSDILAVSQYLASLKSSTPKKTLQGGDIQKGQASYTVCAGCHGMKSEGNKSLNSPALHFLNDWYLQKQLSNFKLGIRGVHPKDAGGNMMRPMALALDEQTIINILAYISSIKN